MKNKVLVTIIDMKYDTSNHLFSMKIKEKESGNEKVLAIRGDDFNFIKKQNGKLFYGTVEVPFSMAEFFCKELIGKDKNLFIEVDKSSIMDIKKDKSKNSDIIDGIKKIDNNISQYPIEETMNHIFFSEKKDSNES